MKGMRVRGDGGKPDAGAEGGLEGAHVDANPEHLLPPHPPPSMCQRQARKRSRGEGRCWGDLLELFDGEEGLGEGLEGAAALLEGGDVRDQRPRRHPLLLLHPAPT
eukprot:70272-Rhodomonas_salina.1